MSIRALRLSLATAAALVVALGLTAPAIAAPVDFDFVGECQSSQGGGCSDFGLMDGDEVSGTFTIDSAHVAGNAIVNGAHLLAGTAFSFTFGDQSWSLSDLDDSTIDVQFSADATRLTCFAGLFGCPTNDYTGFDNGPGFLQAFPESVIATLQSKVQEFASVTGPPLPSQAQANGQWVRDPSNPIPEPSAALMFGVGAVVVFASRRRAAKH